MAFSKNIRAFTLIRPPATFSEKESSGRWGVLSPVRRDNRGRLGTAIRTLGLAKRGGFVAGASWSAAVPAAFGRDPKRCREPHSTTLARMWRLPLPAGEGWGERESAKNCKELQYAINSTDLRMEAVN